jgi:hypothetical protein
VQRVSNTCPVRSLDLGHGSRHTGCDAPVRVAGVTLVSWDQSFYGPIELPSGKKLITLRDATHYITILTKPKHDAEEWQTAIEALLLVAEHGGPTMFAPIGVMRALRRHKPKARPAPRRSTVHGNQAAMDGFGEYRSDLLLRVSSQSTSEAVLNQKAAAIVLKGFSH